MALNEDKLNEFLGRFVTDLGATVAAGNVVIGHQLGLYRSLAAAPATAEGLAERTHTNRRYVTEWLRGQAAGGYVQYDTASDTYSMTEEQAFALTNPDGAVYAPGAFVLALGTLRSVPRITEAFRTSAVDRYLSGVSHAVATDVSVSPFRLTLERHGGTLTPPPPGSQSFWVAQASGNHPTLTWTVTSGSYRVVVMNTDAAAPVAFAGGLDLTIPHLFAFGIGLLIGGIVLIVLAIVLIVLGARTRVRPTSRPVPDQAARA